MTRDTKILLSIIIGVYVFFVVLRVFIFPDLSLAWHLETGVFGFVALVIVAAIIRLIDIQLDEWYPYDTDIVRRLIWQFALSLGVIFALRVVIIWFVHQVVPVRMSKELRATTAVIHVLSVATLILTMFSYRFFKRWKESELKKEILEKEKATVQYDNLKNQLNPHFLFNSLTSLNSLIFENPQLASEFLQQLSRVYRYVLEHKDKTLVNLSTEVDFIANYTKLLLSRFENGLKVNIAIEDADLDKKILPVTLQILIENAIKHNIISRESPLVIDIYTDAAYLIVRNNLQIKHVIEYSNGQGLDNLKNLYKVLIEKEIVIEKTDGSFLVKIPLI
jgi:sensor histidine kinase YesM